MFISGVDNTCDKRGKFLGVIIFIFFKRAYLSALYSCKFLFLLIYIVGTVLSAVSLIPAKNLSAVSLAINFRLLDISDRVVTGDNCSPVINIHSRLSPRIFEKKSKRS